MGPHSVYVYDKAGLVTWQSGVTPVIGGKEGVYHVFHSPMLANEAWEDLEKTIKDELFERIFKSNRSKPDDDED